MIQIFQLLLHVIESLHDRNVILGSNRGNTYHNSKWHLWDSIQWVSIHAMIAYLACDWIYVFTGLLIRLFVLQVFLNYLLGNRIDYLGGGFIDSFCKRNFGKKWTLIVKTALLILSLIYPIIT
jgi:hypothetical protein